MKHQNFRIQSWRLTQSSIRKQDTIWSTCISASFGPLSWTVLAISWRERVRYVWVSRWILRLYIEDTTCITNPRLLSWKIMERLLNFHKRWTNMGLWELRDRIKELSLCTHAFILAAIRSGNAPFDLQKTYTFKLILVCLNKCLKLRDFSSAITAWQLQVGLLKKKQISSLC